MPRHNLRYYLVLLLGTRKRFTTEGVDFLAGHLESFIARKKSVSYGAISSFLHDISTDTDINTSCFILNDTKCIVTLTLEYLNDNDYYFFFKFREPLSQETILSLAQQKKKREENKKAFEKEKISAGYVWHRFPAKSGLLFVNRSEEVLIPPMKERIADTKFTSFWWPLNEEELTDEG